MALCNSQRRALSWYELVILFVFGIVTYHYGGTIMGSEIANSVSSCPRNKSELQRASRRLNCTDPNDVTNTKNRYHCLPVHGLTTLLEFCYNQTRPRVVNGLCMVYVQSKYILDGYNCATFDKGCPNDKYFSDETYLFPYCTDIDPIRKCYAADPSCRITTILITDLPYTGTILRKGTYALSTTAADKQTENENGGVSIFISTLVVMVIIIIAALILYKYKLRRTYHPRKDSNKTQEESPLLDGNIEAEIENLKINFILEKLPKDSSKFPLIANKLKIPTEILFWTKENRKRFVDSMTAGKISVYSGRGMVVGCAEAGKTTLVKKLKGEKDLHTESTSGIEIHSHVFKLYTNKSTNESTIIACKEKEKSKGSLCITPKTLNQQENICTEVLSSVSESTEKPAPTPDNIELQETKDTLKTSTSSILTVENETLRIQDGNGEGNNLEERLSQSSSSTFSEENNSERKSDEEVDLNSCEASVNEENLMMLSLLDFAGQSAYYACHHIFFSPRAFYILVVDMSKNLNDLAKHACTETDLIYSHWTNADYIRYWLGSIHTHSSKTAPVILVASHSERIGVDLKKEEIHKYYHKICRCLPPKLLGHIEEERVFSVEKNSDKNIENLKMCIASTWKSQDHWGENVPIAWARLESFLRKMREEKKICLILDLLKDIQKADRTLLKNREELITALKFFNDTGVILFREEVKNIVILDVQWFVDAFKNIIMDERHIDVKDKNNLTQFDALTDSGLLFNKLLDSLWRKGNFLQHKKSLVYHMKHLDMLAELNSELWYVPCMNKQKYTDTILKNCTVSSTLCFVFEFLPFVIFHRLIVACINKLKMALWKSEGKYCIYHTATILCRMNTTHRVLIGIHDLKGYKCEEYHYSIEIQAIETNPRTLDFQFCSEIKENICQILLELTQTFSMKEKSFQIGYRCTITPYSNDPKNHIILEKDLSSEVDCSQCAPVHAVEVSSIVGFWESKMKSKKKPDKTVWRLLPSVQECASISISNVYNVNHISHVTSTNLWLSSRKLVFKIDHNGDVLQRFRIDDIWGSASHAIDQAGNCLLVRNDKILRCTSKGEETLLTPDWTALSIYSSKFNGDILLGIYRLIEKGSKTKLARYNRNGELLSELEYYEEKRLYVSPMYLSENINRDICTADIDTCLVKAVDKNGKLKFSYNGLPSHANFFPTGICNDSAGHVIMCNRHDSNPSVHLLDMSGEFLSLILHDRDDIRDPWGLCVDDEGRLYLGQNDCSSIKVFKYLEKDN